MKKEIIDAIQKVIGYEFSDKALLIQAFTRESYAKEQRVKGLDCEGNEQLEFFGDTVLGYLVVSGAFDNFTNVVENTGLHVMYKEGKLSEFKSYWTKKERLSDTIDALGLAQYLIMSKGDINQKANEHKSVKEDLFEALVGAMWIDSGKDTKRIEPIIFNMLNIEFNKKTEKNYYSQIIEWADKYKCPFERTVKAYDNGYEVELTVDLKDFYNLDCDSIWGKKAIARTIKEAEQLAAKGLLETLEEYGNYHNSNKVFTEDFNKENAINKLQEYAQKGVIGQVTYTDSLEFAEETQYWKVTCHIANMSIVFDGRGKYKKDAKKDAAYNALCFLTYEVDKENNKFNPFKKKEIYIIDDEATHISVMLVDKYESLFYTGMMYPENEEVVIQENLAGKDAYDNIVEAATNLASYNSPWRIDDATTAPKECEEDGIRLSLYIKDEYEKLPTEIKEDGLKLINKMDEIIKSFKWHPTAGKVYPTIEERQKHIAKLSKMFKKELPENYKYLGRLD